MIKYHISSLQKLAGQGNRPLTGTPGNCSTGTTNVITRHGEVETNGTSVA